MNPRKFDRCLRDVRGYLDTRRDVTRAILYGSAALGTAGPGSDLDLLLVAPEGVHEALALELYRIGARHDVTVSPYLVTQAEVERLDPQFLEAVVRDGTVLKGDALEPSVRGLQLEPYQLVTLELDRLTQKEKVRLSRELYGYESVRKYKRKEYRSRTTGFVESVGGRKLGRGTLLIPARAFSRLEAILERYGGRRWAFTVWVQSP